MKPTGNSRLTTLIPPLKTLIQN